jgi:predicted anti-sigma-YlaC factor YlaD
VTCAEVRSLLPDHLLAMVPETQAAAIRRHLRGCAACRAEMAALDEGLAAFTDAVAPADPSPELRARVLSTLEDEWREAPERPAVRGAALRRPMASWLVAAAAALVLVASVSWGVSQTRRANDAIAGAASYERLLSTLGGTEFRVGALQPVGDSGVKGSVLLYESKWGRSWAAVFVKTEYDTGALSATVTSPDGSSLRFERFWTKGGEGDGWLVTSADVSTMNRVTVRDASGTVLATGNVTEA